MPVKGGILIGQGVAVLFGPKGGVNGDQWEGEKRRIQMGNCGKFGRMGGMLEFFRQPISAQARTFCVDFGELEVGE